MLYSGTFSFMTKYIHSSISSSHSVMALPGFFWQQNLSAFGKQSEQCYKADTDFPSHVCFWCSFWFVFFKGFTFHIHLYVLSMCWPVHFILQHGIHFFAQTITVFHAFKPHLPNLARQLNMSGMKVKWEMCPKSPKFFFTCPQLHSI